MIIYRKLIENLLKMHILACFQLLIEIERIDQTKTFCYKQYLSIKVSD